MLRKFGDGNAKAKAKAKQQSTLAFNQTVEKPTSSDTPGGQQNGSARKEDAEMVDGEDAGSPAQNRDHEEPETKSAKRGSTDLEEEEDDSDDQPVVKRRKRNSKSNQSSNGAMATEEKVAKAATVKSSSALDEGEDLSNHDEDASEEEDVGERPKVSAKKREKLQSAIKSSGKDPYPNWKAGEPVPYAALCKTFSLVEMTTKRLEISAHCSLFLQQVLRLTPHDLLPTVLLMINKLAADYAGIELGIGESLIIKAISESTGRPLAVTKADHQKIGDLGLVAAKSRGTQSTMFKSKPLTIKGVHEGLLAIAKMEGHGSQDKKVGAIKKLLAAADVATGTKNIDINKDKGGPSESKYIVRFLEGKLRLGLAEKTVIVALAQAMVTHEVAQNGKKVPSSDQLAKGEKELKKVYRYGRQILSMLYFADLLL